MLSQALNSQDVELLEKSFHIHDKKIINATVKRLNPALIIELLDQIVVRLQKRPGRASFFVEWIRAALLHHSGYLLSVNVY
jgi:U3 small nucleolar RNA-associated protein 5